MRGVNRNYADEPINIWFQRDASGVTYEMWGYNIDSLDFNAPPPAVPDSITTYDMVHVFTSDTLIHADSTMFDLIYVYKTVVDTVIVSDDWMPKFLVRNAVSRRSIDLGATQNGLDIYDVNFVNSQ